MTTFDRQSNVGGRGVRLSCRDISTRQVASGANRTLTGRMVGQSLRELEIHELCDDRIYGISVSRSQRALC